MGPFDELLDELVAREVSKERKQTTMRPLPEKQSRPGGPTLSPKMALILGSLADSASTYAFLKQGRREANPALQVFNKRHETVIPMGAAGAVGYSLLYDLLAKRSPRMANTLAGLLGGYHGALAGNNLQGEAPDSYGATVKELTLPK